MNLAFVTYWLVIVLLSIFSYGFIDLNLQLSSNPVFTRLQTPLSVLVFQFRPVTTIIFAGILLVLFTLYFFFLRHASEWFASRKKGVVCLALTLFVLVFSFPAFTYDIFNYIATAKVAFTYGENPYIVMPVDIPNEPNLAFTRAANKVALYGPVWLLLTGIPHALGMGNLWLTIIAFKAMNAIVVLVSCWFIYQVTKNFSNVVFFIFNPLVLIETMISGHNDIYMMLFALAGFVLWQQKTAFRKIVGLVLFFSSWWIKGATVALTPLLFVRKFSPERILVYSYWLLAAVFFILAPTREELYPWYAVWLVATAALLPLRRYPFMFGFTIVLSFALELRHVPYMWMGYYGGPGPALRQVLTAVPVVIYILVYVTRKYLPKSS